MSTKTVHPMKCLVTGATGYIALHVVELLCKEGHTVRCTVRSLKNEERNNPIKKLALKPEQIELVEADLLDVGVWAAAVKGIDVVFHLASPFPLHSGEFATADDIIKPAVDGTLNVLKACAEDKVKRVVLTSSGYSIFGDENKNKTYTESDWSDPEKTDTYGKSKILAEKCAWDFLEERKKAGKSVFELAVINPTFVMGPLLSTVFGASGKFFQMNFNSDDAPPASPGLFLPMCDVRDVALAHYRAAIMPEAVGKRHIVASQLEFFEVKKLREILAAEFNPKGMNIKQQAILADAPARCKDMRADTSRLVNVLKIQPTDLSKTFIDMANSFVKLGLTKLE